MTLGSYGKFYGTSTNSARVWDLGLPGPKRMAHALRRTANGTVTSSTVFTVE
jgi:hypothetical protein